MSNSFNAKCACGKVTYTVNEPPMFNMLCHCNACSVGIGMCPVQVYAVTHENFVFKTGEDQIKIFQPKGKMQFARATCCGIPIYQCPEGGSFKCTYPRNFEGYVDGKSNKLPDNLLPTAHCNYENRQYDWNDEAPKFTCYPPDNPCDNKGTILQTEQTKTCGCL